MFKDYYQILEIEQSHPQSGIRSAYKKQAVRWHPDKNPGMDTTSQMQDVNEAFLILNDIEARRRYDLEYEKYKQFAEAKKKREFTQESYSKERSRENVNNNNEYEYSDEILSNWVRNARRQSAEYVKKLFSDVGKLSVDATKAAGSEMLSRFIGFLIVGVVFFILAKACGN